MTNGESVFTQNIIRGAIPLTTSDVSPDNKAQIIYFKTDNAMLESGHAVKISDDMKVDAYTSSSEDNCIGITLGTPSSGMVQVQVSGIMKVETGIADGTGTGTAEVAGKLCTCSSGAISGQSSSDSADDNSDFLVVSAGLSPTATAYVMWSRGSVY